MDFDSIPPGMDFREQIKQMIERSNLVIAIIGPHWLGEQPDASRRIDNPGDFVRLEIAYALEQGIPIIPVLVNNTPMPSQEKLPPEIAGLAFRNAVILDTGIDFHHHADRLIAGIRKAKAVAQRSGGRLEAPGQTAPAAKALPVGKIALWSTGVLLVMAAPAIWFLAGQRPGSQVNERNRTTAAEQRKAIQAAPSVRPTASSLAASPTSSPATQGAPQSTPSPSSKGRSWQDTNPGKPSVTPILTKFNIAVGQVVRLQFQVTGLKDTTTPEHINVDGLEVHRAGTEHHFEVIDKIARSNETHAYTIRPLKPGAFKIPPQTVRAGGTLLATPELTLHVIETPAGAIGSVDTAKTQKSPFDNVALRGGSRKLKNGSPVPSLSAYRPRSVSIQSDAVYRGEIDVESDDGQTLRVPIRVKMEEDITSGTVTEKRSTGDIAISFSGAWDSETFHATIDHVISKPKNIPQEFEAFILHFARDGKTATYQYFGWGKEQAANLRLE
jgi:hypothetical protein